MTTLDERPNTALVVIDMQVAVIADSIDADSVTARIVDLVDRARAADSAVIWVQHDDDEVVKDSDGWQLVPELVPTPGEARVFKNYRDSFEATSLEDHLGAHAVGRLVVAGAHTDFCVRSTLHGALARGYDTVLVGDAHTTDDLTEWGMPDPSHVIAHTNMYWSGQQAPGRTSAVTDAADVVF